MRRPPDIVIYGIVVSGIGIIILVGAYFNLDFAGVLSSSASTTGIAMIGVGFGGIGRGYTIDAYHKLERAAAGEVNQKIAMLYGYAYQVRYADGIDSVGFAHLEHRILSDVATVGNIGKLTQTQLNDIESARDSILYELFETGRDQASIKAALDGIVQAGTQIKRRSRWTKQIILVLALTVLWIIFIGIGVWILSKGGSIVSESSGLSTPDQVLSADGVGWGIIGIGTAVIFMGATQLIGAWQTYSYRKDLDDMEKRLQNHLRAVKS